MNKIPHLIMRGKVEQIVHGLQARRIPLIKQLDCLRRYRNVHILTMEEDAKDYLNRQIDALDEYILES